MSSSFSTGVLIIGASLSGASLAVALARAGVDSCILDKDVFPRPKACGEGLSSRGVALLQKLVPRRSLSTLPCAPFHSYTVSSTAKRIEIPTIAAPRGELYPSIGIERVHLDNAILSAALNEPLVRSRLGTVVRRISSSGGKFFVRINSESLEASAVVLACGGSSGLLARQASRPLRAGKTWKADGRFRSRYDTVHIHLKPGHEIFFTRVSGYRLNISVLADTPASLRTVSPAELLRLAAEHCDFAGEMAGSPLGAGALSSYARPAVESGMLLVGDACEVFDPIGGMGMTHALVSAELAAESLVRWLSGGQSHEAALADYALRHRSAAAPLKRFTRAVFFALKRLPQPMRTGVLRATAFVGSVRVGADTSDRRNESTRQSADR